MTDCFICHDGKDCKCNGKCPMCGRVRPDKHRRPTKRAADVRQRARRKNFKISGAHR